MNRSSAHPLRPFHALTIAFATTVAAAFTGGCSGGTDARSGTPSSDGGTSSTSPTESGDGGSEAAAATGPRAACDKYLSCLLAVTPTAYAPAVQLYGEESACWATPAQSAGCEKSCEAAFENIAKECTCTGTSCTACDFPYGTYQATAAAGGTCALQAWDISITKSGSQPTLRVRFDVSDDIEVPLVCGTPPTFAQEIEGPCTETWTGDVTEAPTGKDIVVEGSRKRTCPGDTPTTCTFRLAAKRISP